MIYLSNDPYPQEISIPRSFGVIVPRRTEYLTRDDIATDLETDTDRKVLAASQGVRLKEMVDGKADASDVYTKTEVDDALDDKADKADTYTKQQVDTALAGKQDTINDLQTIRDGAAAGATAYQKPQTGIPASDIAPGVIPTIPVEDVKVGGTSVVNNKIAEIPAIPDAVEANPTIPAGVTPVDLQNLKVGDEFFSIPQGGGEPEIFWATYGETTAQEVQNAIDAGKIVKAIYSNVVVEYNNENTTAIRFASLSSPTMKGLRVTLTRSNNRWSAEIFGYELDSNKSQSIETDRTSTTKYPSVKAVFDSLGKWGIVKQLVTYTKATDKGYDKSISDIEWGIIPTQFIEMAESGFIGEVHFNEETGYFEMNEILDISYAEMREIYHFKNLLSYYNGGDMFGLFGVSGPNPHSSYYIRTLYSDLNRRINIVGSWFRALSAIETISFIPNNYNVQSNRYVWFSNTANIGYIFYNGCNVLRKILIPMRCNTNTSFTNTCFSGCPSLEFIQILQLHSNIWFSNSARLNLESVVYMVENATNTAAITITLHATAYARCQADTTEYTYQGNTYTGILAYAAAKNITIASA